MSGKFESGIKANNQMRNRNYPEYGVDGSGSRVGGDYCGGGDAGNVVIVIINGICEVCEILGKFEE